MNYLRLLAPLALVCSLALAGCTTTFTNPVNQNVVFGAVSGYGIAQSAIIAYGHLPFCAKGTTTTASNYCQDPNIEVKLSHANAAVSTARKALEGFVRNPANYPGLTYGQLYQTFLNAQATLSQIAAEYGVH